MKIDLTKYLTTEDILGFSWSGRRNESDYDTFYTMMNPIQLLQK